MEIANKIVLSDGIAGERSERGARRDDKSALTRFFRIPLNDGDSFRDISRPRAT
jgi:hypothetical protein